MCVVVGAFGQVFEQRRSFECVDSGVNPSGSSLTSREDSHRCALSKVKLQELFQGLGTNKRHIAGEKQNVFVAGDSFSRRPNRPSCAGRISLTSPVSPINEADSKSRYRSFHSLRLLAGDNVNIGGIDDLAGCCDDVTKQWLAPNFMQRFGAARIEASCFAVRHDNHGQLRA